MNACLLPSLGCRKNWRNWKDSFQPSMISSVIATTDLLVWPSAFPVLIFCCLAEMRIAFCWKGLNVFFMITGFEFWLLSQRSWCK